MRDLNPHAEAVASKTTVSANFTNRAQLERGRNCLYVGSPAITLLLAGVVDICRWSYEKYMAGRLGLEPRPAVLETAMLPLHHRPEDQRPCHVKRYDPACEVLRPLNVSS